MEEDEERHALLERAAKLMAKAGYRAYSVRIEVAGKEKGYGMMESSFYFDMVTRRNPPQVNDARFWHPWLRINRVLRVRLHTRLERGGVGRK